MEDAPGAPTVVRNGGGHFPPVSSTSSSSSSHPSRKEWRVVSDPTLGNTANEGLERSKMGQPDERLNYEVQRGREPVDVDFCTITVDDVSDNGILQQKLHTLSKQREELQRVEIELRAQVLVRSEIVGFQKAFDSQAKEHANATKKLQEQFREKELRIHELEKMLDEKERELHAIRMDNEAHAWAKDDLLREQGEELQNYRMERDNSNVERVQHIKQIHELQEHIQEKERQFMELQEQHRVAQEAIIYKEEQMRDAQNWISRAQEMESLQSTANQTLQAELRERSEQYNQLWLGFQRQVRDMERLHLHIQQLQHELADAREKNGSHADGSHPSSTNSSDVSRVGHVTGNHLEFNDSNSSVLPNGNLQNSSSESSVANNSQTEGAHGFPYASSLYGMPGYLPSTLHPFLMHHQGLIHPPHVTQAHFVPLQGISPAQHWTNQQAPLDGENIHLPNQSVVKADEHILKADSSHGHGEPINAQDSSGNMLNSEVAQGLEVDSVIPTSGVRGQVEDFLGTSNGPASPAQNSDELAHNSLSLDSLAVGNERKEIGVVNNHELDPKATSLEQPNATNHEVPSELPSYKKNSSEAPPNAAIGTSFSGSYVSSRNKINAIDTPVESHLMDEIALLACVARSIGSGGRIKISSTLPNRLGKMLAPLHWHDYKRKYGKLDDFVATHPKLFLIEGDNIQLREGAQKIIAAMAVAAKIEAAAASPPPHSSLFPVALTPMAQSHKLKKSSFHGTSSNCGRAPNLKISSRSSDSAEVNNAENEPGRSVSNPDRIDNPQVGTVSRARSTPSAARKQSGRSISSASVARR